MDNQCVIILGMHRSGTSALSGCLQSAGLELGDVNNWSEDNLQGNRESRKIITLHEDILERNNVTWDNPKKPLPWHPIHKYYRDLYIKQFTECKVWGFKDPRTVLLLQGWLKILPNAILVAIFRHPYLVADSLYKRNNIPYKQGLELWIHYNRELLWYIENHQPHYLLEFDLSADVFVSSIKKLTCALGLTSHESDFFKPELRRISLPDIEPSKATRRALFYYNKLRQLSSKEI